MFWSYVQYALVLALNSWLSKIQVAEPPRAAAPHISCRRPWTVFPESQVHILLLCTGQVHDSSSLKVMAPWRVEIGLGLSLVTLLFLRIVIHTNRLFQHGYDDAMISTQLLVGDAAGRGEAGLANMTADVGDYSRCVYDKLPPLRGRNNTNARLAQSGAESVMWRPEKACIFSPGKDAAAFSNLYTCSIGDTKITLPKAPSFMIIGAQKGGTSSLFEYLQEHPSIAPTMNVILSGGRRNEVHFFDFEWALFERNRKQHVQWSDSDYYCHAAKHYVETNFDVSSLLKADAEGKVLLSFDKTPRYILRPHIPEQIKRTCPWLTKLIAVLRNPVDRAFSEFNMDTQRMKNRKTMNKIERTQVAFDEAVREELLHLQENGLVRKEYDFSGDNVPKVIVPPALTPEEEDRIFSRVEPQKPRYMKRGMYALQLHSWGQHYAFHDELMVINSDDFHDGGERETFERVLKHTGLPHYVKEDFHVVHSRAYDFAMLNKTRELLETFYRPYNLRLSALLGKDWEGVWDTL